MKMLFLELAVEHQLPCCLASAFDHGREFEEATIDFVFELREVDLLVVNEGDRLGIGQQLGHLTALYIDRWWVRNI